MLFRSVEILTPFLSELCFDFDNEEKLLKRIQWKSEYGQNLIKQIKKVNFWGNETKSYEGD